MDLRVRSPEASSGWQLQQLRRKGTMLVKQYIISIVPLLYSCEKENDVAPWGEQFAKTGCTFENKGYMGINKR